MRGLVFLKQLRALVLRAPVKKCSVASRHVASLGNRGLFLDPDVCSNY